MTRLKFSVNWENAWAASASVTEFKTNKKNNNVKKNNPLKQRRMIWDSKLKIIEDFDRKCIDWIRTNLSSYKADKSLDRSEANRQKYKKSLHYLAGL